MGLFRKKQGEGQSERIFKCKDCDMKFQDKQRLKRHARKAHTEKGGHMTNPNPFGGF